MIIIIIIIIECVIVDGVPLTKLTRQEGLQSNDKWPRKHSTKIKGKGVKNDANQKVKGGLGVIGSRKRCNRGKGTDVGETYDQAVCLDGVDSAESTKVVDKYDISKCIEEIDNCFGESKSGRLRLALARDSNAKTRRLCEATFKCTSIEEIVGVLKSKASLRLYYAGRDNLSDSIKGDGLCSIRTAMVLEQGMY